MVTGGKVESDGWLRLDRERDHRAYLHRLKGQRVEVVVRKVRTQRSQQQNKYLHGVVLPLLAEAFGNDVHEHDALHYALLAECFGTYEVLGRQVPKRTSSQLSVAEFQEYLDWLIRFGAEHGVIVPLPNEVEA